MSDAALKRPGICEDTSRRITSLRYFLILLVIFAHNMLTEERLVGKNVLLNENLFGHWIKLFFSESISRGLVPLFFLFAAFLQYKKDDPYLTLLKKKSRSLLLPYMLWPLINMGLILLKGVIHKFIPAVTIFPVEDSFLTWNWKQWVNCWLGYGNRGGLPLIMQLWFVRDLFILIVFSPLIKYFVKKFPFEYLTFISFIYICDIQTVYMSNIAVLFYSLGFFCAEYEIDFFKFADRLKWKAILPVFALIWIYRWTKGVDYTVCEQVMGFVATFILMKISGLFVSNEKFFKVTAYFSRVSFFLYCAHNLFLLANAQLYWIQVFQMKNTFWSLAEYFGVWFIVVFVGTSVGLLLKKFCNPLFVILNGGRG